MGSAEKTETPMPKAMATAGEIQVGSLRLQSDRGNDEVHVHDGTLRFRFKGIRKFHLAFDDFKASLASLRDGAIVVFPGDPSDPGSGRIACDMVMRFAMGKWTCGLNACGTMAGVIFGDDVIFSLDEFIQRA